MIDVEMVQKLSPAARIDFIEAQMRDCHAGKMSEILCPYCLDTNFDTNEFLCCEVFANAVNAILYKWDLDATIEAGEKIKEALCKQEEVECKSRPLIMLQ